jgi:hypothetical protein
MEGRLERTKIYGPTARWVARADRGGVIHRRDGWYGCDDGARLHSARPCGAAILSSLDDDGLQLDLRIAANGGRWVRRPLGASVDVCLRIAAICSGVGGLRCGHFHRLACLRTCASGAASAIPVRIAMTLLGSAVSPLQRPRAMGMFSNDQGGTTPSVRTAILLCTKGEKDDD